MKHLLITFENCAVGYEAPVLRNLNLSIEKGDFVSVVGPTGIGKSTLLRLIGDMDLNAAKPSVHSGVFKNRCGSNMGIVFQSLEQLLPWKTAIGNLTVIGHSKDMAFEKAELYEKSKILLEEVGLGDHLNKYPCHLSGGMRQRVAIARAMLKTPELLLMDEPFGSLDGFTRERLQQLLSALREKHAMTVLFITHDVSEAVKMATQVLVIDADGVCTTLKKLDFDSENEMHREIMRILT